MKTFAIFWVILLTISYSGIYGARFRSIRSHGEGEGEGLIYGGRNAGKGQFPWHVGMYRRVGVLPFDQKCSGSLVSPSIVVTAAHCIGDIKNPSSYRVVAGTLERSFNSEERGRQVRNVQAIVVHPRFSSGNFINDIALFILNSPMQITTYVKPVGLDVTDQWTSTQLVAGREGLAAGWGVSNTERLSDLLQTVNLPYIDIRTCQNSVAPTFKKYATEEKFCGGYIQKNISLCKGDSGGGFAFPVPGSDDKYILRGVASLAFRPYNFDGECYADHYTAFTQVTKQSLLEMYKTVSSNLQGLFQQVLGIPGDYKHVPGHGFYKAHAGKPFGQAWMTCLQEGTNLAVFESDAEATAVCALQIIQPYKDKDVFIGVHDLYLEGTFVDVYGKLLGGRTRWHPNEPNNDNGNEDCAALHCHSLSLNDVPCDRASPFICKGNDI